MLVFLGLPNYGGSGRAPKRWPDADGSGSSNSVWAAANALRTAHGSDKQPSGAIVMKHIADLLQQAQISASPPTPNNQLLDDTATIHASTHPQLIQMGMPHEHLRLFTHLTQSDLDKIIGQPENLRLIRKLLDAGVPDAHIKAAIHNLLANEAPPAPPLPSDNPPATDGDSKHSSAVRATATMADVFQGLGMRAPPGASDRQIDLAAMATKTASHKKLMDMGVSGSDIHLFFHLQQSDLDKITGKPNGLQHLIQRLTAGMSIDGAKKAINQLLVGDSDAVASETAIGQGLQQDGLSRNQRSIVVKTSVSVDKKVRNRRASTNEKRPAAAQNKTPTFPLPDNLKKIPPTNQTLVRRLQEEDLPTAFCDYVVVMRYLMGMRLGVSELYVTGMKVVLAALFASMNMSTLQCHTNGRQLAKTCSLTTSQISRHLTALERTGLITRTLFRGPGGLFVPQQINITAKLLELFGYRSARLATLQKQHQRYSKLKNQQPLCITPFIKKAFKKARSAFKKSIVNLEEKIKPPLIFFTKIKRDFAVALAQKVEDTLMAFSLGRYCSTFSTA